MPYRTITKPGVAFRQQKVLLHRSPTQAWSPTQARTSQMCWWSPLAPIWRPGQRLGSRSAATSSTRPRARPGCGDVLADFAGGNVIISVLGGFFKCPPAPYETAFMLHDYLSRRGVRDATAIHLVTPMPKPIPISDETSDAIIGLLDKRGIRHTHGSLTTQLDPAAKVAHLKDGQQMPFDLLLAVPVHRAPRVVVESGLTEDGWIPVDPATLATKFPGVYAVGDVTSAPVPRAGVIAEGEASAVADVLIAHITGAPPPAPYRGEMTCYVEMGDDTIGTINANFLSGPVPTAVMTLATAESADDKRRFAASRRDRWFGPGPSMSRQIARPYALPPDGGSAR